MSNHDFPTVIPAQPGITATVVRVDTYNYDHTTTLARVIGWRVDEGTVEPVTFPAAIPGLSSDSVSVSILIPVPHDGGFADHRGNAHGTVAQFVSYEVARLKRAGNGKAAKRAANAA